MAEIMNLNASVSDASVIDCEVRRRVWWSLYTTDMWCMSGQGLRSQLKDVQAKIELPMNDRTFMLLGTDHSVITGHQGSGMWAHLTTLVPLFGPIHNINRLTVDNKTYTIRLDEQVEQLARNLEDWKKNLPNDAQMNEDNLYRQQRAGLGGLLLSIHLAYHYFSILLYFRYLDAQPPTSSNDRTYIARCKVHATSFSSLLSLSRQLKGCDVVFPALGHMATVSSSVLVHTLLFGEPDEIETARQELNTNFEALIEFTQYWPATSAMVCAGEHCTVYTRTTNEEID